MEIGFIILSIIFLILSINNKVGNRFLGISFFLLFILLGFRDVSVGTDTINYLTIFERVVNSDYKGVEPGWIFLNNLTYYLGLKFEFLLVLTALLTLAPVYYIIKRSSVNPMLSLFFYYTLYFYFDAFNITRQALAVVIVLVAMVQLINNKKIFFILIVLLASTFHLTALIALPLIFVDKIPDNMLIYLLGIPISLLIGVVGFEIFYKIAPNTEYAHYAEAVDIDNLKAGKGFLLALNAFFVFVLLVIKEKDIHFKMFFVYVLSQNLTTKVPYGYRLVLYFSIIQVLFLPLFVKNNKLKGNEKILCTVAVILYTYILLYRLYGNGDILPYSNILFE